MLEGRKIQIVKGSSSWHDNSW